ncbi:hypothetical protein D3C84_1134430 [compost metagenome]
MQVPLTGAHVEITGARSIAILAATAAGEPVVEVVVGQQDAGDAGKHFRVLFFGPEQL